MHTYIKHCLLWRSCRSGDESDGLRSGTVTSSTVNVVDNTVPGAKLRQHAAYRRGYRITLVSVSALNMSARLGAWELWNVPAINVTSDACLHTLWQRKLWHMCCQSICYAAYLSDLYSTVASYIRTIFERRVEWVDGSYRRAPVAPTFMLLCMDGIHVTQTHSCPLNHWQAFRLIPVNAAVVTTVCR